MLFFHFNNRQQKPIQKLVNAVKTINFLNKTCKNSNDLLELTVLALIKPVRMRTQEETQVIEKLMARFKFFQELKNKQGTKVFSEFCQHLYLRVSEINEKVIKKGEYGSTFFVLLTGSVRVMIFNPKNLRAKKQVEYQQMMLNQGQNIIPEYDNPELFESMNISTLHPGSTFGDLALLQTNAITSATIVTNSRCEFACMDRRSFWKYSGKSKQEELDHKLSILKQLPFLNFWHEMELKTISYEFKSKQFFKGETIFKEGEKNQGLYMIINGEVTLTKSIYVSGGTVNSQLSKYLQTKQKQSDKLFIAALTFPEYFGDDKEETYQYSATCQTLSVNLLFISRSDLEKRLNWNEDSKLILEKLMCKKQFIEYLQKGKKNSWRQKREIQLSHKLLNQKFLSTDGEVIDVNQLKKYLHLKEKVSEPIIPVQPQNIKLQDRISKKEVKYFHLDFMLPDQVLNQPDFENDNLPQQQTRQKINSTTSINSLDPLQRAKNLGLGTLCKSFRELQNEERKRKEAFQKDLQKLLKTTKRKKQILRSDQIPSMDTCSIIRQRSIQMAEIRSNDSKSPEKQEIQINKAFRGSRKISGFGTESQQQSHRTQSMDFKNPAFKKRSLKSFLFQRNSYNFDPLNTVKNKFVVPGKSISSHTQKPYLRKQIE